MGSHAAKALRGAGYRVVVFDNLWAGHRAAALGSTLVEGDIQDTAMMHFAALLRVGNSVRDPAGYYRTNVGGTLSLLDAMGSESIETPIPEGHPNLDSIVETAWRWHRTHPHGFDGVAP